MWLERFHHANLICILQLSSMASWHGPELNVFEARSLLQSSCVGSPSTQWMPAQSSPYGAVVPFQPSSSTLGMPLSKFPSFYGFSSSFIIFIRFCSTVYLKDWSMINNHQVHTWGNKYPTSCHLQGNFIFNLFCLHFLLSFLGLWNGTEYQKHTSILENKS